MTVLVLSESHKIIGDYMITIPRHEADHRAAARKHFGWDPEHANPVLHDEEAIFFADCVEYEAFLDDLRVADRLSVEALEVVA